MDGKHGHSPNTKLRSDTVNGFGHRKSRNPWSALKAWLLCITCLCSWRSGFRSVKQRLDLQSLVMEPIIVMAWFHRCASFDSLQNDLVLWDFLVTRSTVVTMEQGQIHGYLQFFQHFVFSPSLGIWMSFGSLHLRDMILSTFHHFFSYFWFFGQPTCSTKNTVITCNIRK